MSKRLIFCLRSAVGVCALLCALFVKAQPVNSALIDPHLWLEEVQGDKALAWVRERNSVSTAQLQAAPEQTDLHAA